MRTTSVSVVERTLHPVGIVFKTYFPFFSSLLSELFAELDAQSSTFSQLMRHILSDDDTANNDVEKDVTFFSSVMYSQVRSAIECVRRASSPDFQFRF